MIISDKAPDATAETENLLRQVLPHLSTDSATELHAHLDPYPVDIIEESKTGLVVITVKDAFGEPFYLGEALVSRAEVAYDGIRGHATVIGDDPVKAKLAATVNAFGQHPHASGLLRQFRGALLTLAKKVETYLAEEQRLMAATRVSFQSMAKEEI